MLIIGDIPPVTKASVLVSVAIVTIVAGLVILEVRDKKQVMAPEPSSNLVVMATANWITYTYSQDALGFSIQLPSDWKITPRPDEEMRMGIDDQGFTQLPSFLIGPEQIILSVDPNNPDDDPKIGNMRNIIKMRVGKNGMLDSVGAPDYSEEHNGRTYLYVKNEEWSMQEVAIPLKDGYYLILFSESQETRPILDTIVRNITFESSN